MTRFTSRRLAILENLFDFIGGQRGSQEVDLVSPVVRVVDVSRQAELAATLIIELSHSLTTGGAGAAAFTTVDVDDFFTGTLGGIQDTLEALGRKLENTDVWLHQVGMFNSGTDFGGAAMGYIFPNALQRRLIQTSPGASTYNLLAHGNATNADLELTAAGLRPIVFNTAAESYSQRHLANARLPVPVGTVVCRATDDGTGATTVTYREIFSFVPTGAAPPTIAS